MNAILTFPKHLLAEIEQARRDVSLHLREIEVSVGLFQPDHLAWKARDREINTRLAAIRQRLASLPV